MLNQVWVSSGEASELLQTKSVLTPPNRLPSIVPPKLYKFEDGRMKLGGYQLNDIAYSEDVILKKPYLLKQSIIHQDNIIYDVINKLNSVAYKINTDVLNFIELNMDFYKDELVSSKHDLEDKNKLTSRERKILQKHLNKFNLQNHILNLAKAYAVIPSFYFINRLDYRGRLYCVTEYLNYQSTDLAKALLLFSIPNKIQRIGSEIPLMYFSVFGANCFGNKKDKLSITEKVDWVKANRESIINYHNGDIIQQSENKFLFTAFCVEYKK